jgi:hypothetical protein
MLLVATALVGGVIAVPAMVSPVLADVNVAVSVDKDKSTIVQVTVDINKDIEIDVNLISNLDGLAQSDAFVNAISTGNTVDLGLLGCVEGAEGCSFTKRLASITGSLIGSTGVIQLNQDVGDNANQGNVISAALVDVQDVPATEDVFEASVAHAEAAVDQKSTNNKTEFEGTFPGFPSEQNPLVAEDFHVRAEIIGSVNGNTGIMMVNQNAGQNTNQHNVLSLAVGIDAAVALAEGDLGQESSGNEVDDITTFKRDLIEGSINANAGIVAVNQATGHNNNQATVMTVAATSAASALVPGPGL